MRATVGLAVFFLALMLAHPLHAVEVHPDDAAVKAAIEKGKTHKDDPAALYEGYEFGERGVAVNGYLMTKLFEIAQLSAVKAAKGEALDPETVRAVLEKEYLLVPIYLVAEGESLLDDVSVSLRQGLKTIGAAKILKDPVKKALCEKDVCLYKRDVYAGFIYKEFDPKRVAVLVVSFGDRKSEFPLALQRIK